MNFNISMIRYQEIYNIFQFKIFQRFLLSYGGACDSIGLQQPEGSFNILGRKTCHTVQAWSLEPNTGMNISIAY